MEFDEICLTFSFSSSSNLQKCQHVLKHGPFDGHGAFMGGGVVGDRTICDTDPIHSCNEYNLPTGNHSAPMVRVAAPGNPSLMGAPSGFWCGQSLIPETLVNHGGSSRTAGVGHGEARYLGGNPTLGPWFSHATLEQIRLHPWSNFFFKLGRKSRRKLF